MRREPHSLLRRWAPPNRLLAGLIVAGAIAGVVYEVVRFSQTVWFSRPYFGCTTGSEEEALYALWKWLHGLPVYGDMFDIPYAASYFNWLFYAVYGTVNWLVLTVSGAGEEMIPAISRCTTLLLHLLALGFVVAIGRQLRLRFFLLSRDGGWGYAAFAVLNLCYGLWAITCRPDVGALLLELIGFWTILKYEAGHRRVWLLAIVASLYCAWAFKQNCVTVITVYCLALLLRRRFAELLCVALPTFALYAITFLVGGPLYGYACVLSQSQMGLSPLFGAQNFLLASVKAPLLGVAVCLIPAFLVVAKRSVALPKRLLVGTFLGSLLLALVASMKAGAYVNYFFLPGALGALCLADLCGNLRWPRLALLARYGVACAAVFQVGTIAQRLLHREGTVILQRQHAPAVSLRQELPSLPAPVLVYSSAMNLPWIQARPPHFVYAFTYFGDRQTRQFRHDGMGGLVREGFFGTVALEKSTPPVFDGQPLGRYRLSKSDAYFDYYVRTQPPAPAE